MNQAARSEIAMTFGSIAMEAGHGIIDDGKPVAGAVYAPALNRLYVAAASAFRSDVRPTECLTGMQETRALTTRVVAYESLRAVISYSRLAPATDAVLVAAGGCAVQVDDAPLRYGKSEAGFRNQSFIAWGTQNSCDSDRCRAGSPRDLN